MDRAWADAHGLAYAQSNVVAKDILGSVIETAVARDVRMRFGDIETRPVDLVVIEMPEILRFVGVSVIWSPQTTVPEGKLLRLDFAGGTMQLRDDDLAAGTDALCVGRGFDYGSPVVSATVGGDAPERPRSTGWRTPARSPSSPARRGAGEYADTATESARPTAAPSQAPTNSCPEHRAPGAPLGLRGHVHSGDRRLFRRSLNGRGV